MTERANAGVIFLASLNYLNIKHGQLAHLDVEVCEVDPYRCDMYLEAIFFLFTLNLFQIFRLKMLDFELTKGKFLLMFCAQKKSTNKEYLLDSGLEKYVCRCQVGSVRPATGLRCYIYNRLLTGLRCVTYLILCLTTLQRHYKIQLPMQIQIQMIYKQKYKIQLPDWTKMCHLSVGLTTLQRQSWRFLAIAVNQHPHKLVIEYPCQPN